MKNQLLLLSFAVVFSVFLFNACKKDKVKDTLDSQTQQFTNDANSVKSENDQADNDINNSLTSIPAMGGRLDNTLSSPLCGCTIDSSQVSSKILFFNFDGTTPCFALPRRTRGGKIKVQLTSGNHWSDQGAILTITFFDFKVTRMSDNYSMTFNGVKTLTNVSGSNWLTFLLGSSNYVYRERANNIQVKFNDNSTAVWNSARTTTWSYTPATAAINFNCNGDTSINGIANTDSWGTNRYAQTFQIYYKAPWVSNTYCGLWTPNSGELVYSLVSKEYTLTLGVNQDGNASTLPCAYGFKVSWTKSDGSNASVVLSY